MNSVASYSLAALFALLLHGLVLALVSVNWNESTVRYTDIKPYYIQAQVVAENPYKAKEKRAQDAVRTERQRKLEQRRRDEINFRKQQSAWEAEQKNKKPEPVKAEPITSVPAPADQKPSTEPEVDEEEVRASFEEGLSQALIDELNLRKAVTDDEKAMAYVAQIQREIIRNWSRPPSARNGMEALLRVRLFPTGELMDVKVEESSGNDAFDRSATLAVRKAGRFVVPSDSRRFERDFRQFTVLFKPDDLRL